MLPVARKKTRIGITRYRIKIARDYCPRFTSSENIQVTQHRHEERRDCHCRARRKFLPEGRAARTRSLLCGYRLKPDSRANWRESAPADRFVEFPYRHLSLSLSLSHGVHGAGVTIYFPPLFYGVARGARLHTKREWAYYEIAGIAGRSAKRFVESCARR